MRKFLLVALACIPAIAQAQTQLATWTIENVDFIDAATIELEIEAGQKHFLAYGVLISSENTGFSAHGSCYSVASGNAICELDVRGTTWIMTLGSTLHGTVSVRNASDTVIDEGSLTFQSIE